MNNNEPIIKSIDELYAKVITADGNHGLIRMYLTGNPNNPWTYDFITTNLPDLVYFSNEREIHAD